MTHPVPISISERWQTNGSCQSVIIRGRDRRNPALIWVGDFACEMPLLRRYQSALEDDFTVVYWSQRHSGRSFAPFEQPAPVSLDLYVKDLTIVLERISERLRKEKFVVAGHSSGSILGLRYTAEHPTRVSAYVGIGQVIDAQENLRRGREWARGIAAERNDTLALRELDAIGPPPFGTVQARVLRRWIIAYGGAFHQNLATESWRGRRRYRVTRPGVTSRRHSRRIATSAPCPPK